MRLHENENNEVDELHADCGLAGKEQAREQAICFQPFKNYIFKELNLKPLPKQAKAIDHTYDDGLL